jgi:small subunit ribosomal protein S15
MRSPSEETMARLHAHRKGKSGSTRPYLKASPEWVGMEKAEIEEEIVRLHQEGLSTAAIGVRLRDGHGVPNVRLATGRSVKEILLSKGAKFALPEDLASLIRRAASLQAHIKEHRKDLSNKRGLQLIESRIRRLSRYYKELGVLPSDWDYSLKLADLQVK